MFKQILKIIYWKGKSRGAIYARSPILEFLIGIPYNLFKWRDNMAKLDKILFIVAILYKSLHMVLGSGGSESQGY